MVHRIKELYNAQRILPETMDGGHNFTLFLVGSLSRLLGKHLFDSFYHVLGDLLVFGLLDLACGPVRCMACTSPFPLSFSPPPGPLLFTI